MGAGEPEPATLEAARRFGRLVAEAGWILLTGGRPAGVMDAASAGAKEVPGSITLGILPSGPGGPVSVTSTSPSSPTWATRATRSTS